MQTAPTTTGEFAGFLKPEEAEAYFEDARKMSAVQQLVRQVPLGINGKDVPVTTSKPSAKWVGEGQRKHSSSGGKTLKTLKPRKLATISVVSAEVVRSNPAGYMTDLRADIAEAFAVAFDAAALHGTDSPFDNYVAQTSKSVALGTASRADGGIYADVNAGLELLVNDGKRMRGSIFDDTTEPLFNAAVDLNGRPLFVDSPTTENAATIRSGRLLGRPSHIAEGVGDEDILGFSGDWSKAVWGVVGGISYDVSRQATVTLDGELVSLWENNLVAVLAEAEYGWLLHDEEAFVAFTEPTAGGGEGE